MELPHSNVVSKLGHHTESSCSEFSRAWKVAPALACGCTIVMKPSEFTPLTALVSLLLLLETSVVIVVFSRVLRPWARRWRGDTTKSASQSCLFYSFKTCLTLYLLPLEISTTSNASNTREHRVQYIVRSVLGAATPQSSARRSGVGGLRHSGNVAETGGYPSRIFGL